MKWCKFRKYVAEHPWLADAIDPFGYLRHDVEKSAIKDSISPLRDFVRNRLGYIAFRRWQELSDPFSTKGMFETTNTLEYALRCDPYFGGSLEASYHEEWEIVWHVGDRKMAASPHRDGFTLRESMIEIEVEHSKGLFGVGDLFFDFIVRRITESKSKKAAEMMALEIYAVPFGPLQRQAKEEKCPEVPEWKIASRRAFIEGGTMPPIVPQLMA